MSAKLLQLVGSLLAVGLLVLIAWLLRLGGGAARIAGEAEARELADNTLCGFDAIEIALDRDGRGALLRDGAGRILVLAPHGNRFAGRLLGARARSRIEGGRLVIETGERRFPAASLALADAAAWSRAIEALD